MNNLITVLLILCIMGMGAMSVMAWILAIPAFTTITVVGWVSLFICLRTSEERINS